MPYISAPRRESFALARNTLKTTRIDTIGELEYLLCYMADLYLSQHIMNFDNLNAVVGAFESGKMEVYRRLVAEYEDQKIASNGDVFRQEGK